jgi:hypothetical protein
MRRTHTKTSFLKEFKGIQVILFAGHCRISLSFYVLLKTLEDKIYKPGILSVVRTFILKNVKCLCFSVNQKKMQSTIVKNFSVHAHVWIQKLLCRTVTGTR